MAKSTSTKTTQSKKDTVSKTKTATTKTTKKATEKKATTVKAKEKVDKSKTTRKATTKSSTSKEKVTTKAQKTKRASSAKNTAPKSKNTSRTKRAQKDTVATTIEYYDLPNTYDLTTVKLLFQTPKKLFVYWEISEADRQKYIVENGNDFFEKTIPFLLVRNKTKNYSFEVEVNDFANSWYFDIPDSNCEYEVELIRKDRLTQALTYITSSNEMEVPNNHILFEQNRKEIFFKNVKTNSVVSKSIVNLHFMKHLGNIYNSNSFYRKFYTEHELFEISNPTSN